MTHVLDELFEVIESRKNAAADESYVASLFKKGTPKIAQKVSEESVETIIEAVQNNRDALKQESADLLFHLMVLWADQDIKPQDIFDVLEARMGTSGHEEKRRRAEP